MSDGGAGSSTDTAEALLAAVLDGDDGALETALRWMAEGDARGRTVVAGLAERARAAEQPAALRPVADHLGLAVSSLDEGLAFWRDALGLELAHVEEVESERVRVAMLPVGESCVELLEPVGDEGAVQTFLAKRGPGVHHLCLRVPDIEAALERLRARDVRIVGEAPRPGAEGKLVAFIHPRSTSGVLVELSQDAPATGEGS